MIKKVISILLGVLISQVAYGQQDLTKAQKTVTCGKTELILNIMSKQYGEVPIFYGSELNDDEVKYLLAVNPKTGGWTIVQFNQHVACVLGSGDRPQLNLKEIYKD